MRKKKEEKVMRELHESYSSKSEQITRVKAKRKTVGVTLPVNLVERAREHGLNISRITTEALTSILAYLEQTDTQRSFLGEASFTKEGSMVRSPGFEPGSSAWQADVLVQTRRRPHRLNFIFGFLFPFLKRGHY